MVIWYGIESICKLWKYLITQEMSQILFNDDETKSIVIVDRHSNKKRSKNLIKMRWTEGRSR